MAASSVAEGLLGSNSSSCSSSSSFVGEIKLPSSSYRFFRRFGLMGGYTGIWLCKLAKPPPGDAGGPDKSPGELLPVDPPPGDAFPAPFPPAPPPLFPGGAAAAAIAAFSLSRRSLSFSDSSTSWITPVSYRSLQTRMMPFNLCTSRLYVAWIPLSSRYSITCLKLFRSVHFWLELRRWCRTVFPFRSAGLPMISSEVSRNSSSPRQPEWTTFCSSERKSLSTRFRQKSIKGVLPVLSRMFTRWATFRSLYLVVATNLARHFASRFSQMAWRAVLPSEAAILASTSTYRSSSTRSEYPRLQSAMSGVTLVIGSPRFGLQRTSSRHCFTRSAISSEYGSPHKSKNHLW
mmetsp:Transcript_11204/g.27390  ORF Transcript_11204/g.27390 Transcript_11204/m.27390 type:complete len:347 (-) Transcript_11204:1202-2242(-)